MRCNSWNPRVWVLLLGVVLIQTAVGQHCMMSTETEPQPMQGMPTCCWYESLSCCTKQSFLSIIGDTMNYMADNIAHKSQKDIDCLALMEDFYCVLCSTAAPDFSDKNHSTGDITVNICSDWCGSLYYACNGLSWFGTYEDPNEACGTLNGLLSHVLVDITPSIEGHPGTCFEGVGAATVEASVCFRYEVDDTDIEYSSAGSPEGRSPESPGSPASPGSPMSPGERSPGEEDDAPRFQGLWWFLGTSGGAILLFVVVGAAIGGMVLFQKWRRGRSVHWVTGDEDAMAVEMDELDDDDAADDLDDFVQEDEF